MNEDKIAPELNEADKLQKQKESLEQYEGKIVELLS